MSPRSRHGCREILARCRAARRLGVHSTMRAQASAFASLTPAQLSQYARRPFVTDSLRKELRVLTQPGSPSDRPSCELTRRFPKRTTSADHSEFLACPIRYGQPADELRFVTRLDSVASSRVGSFKHRGLLPLTTLLRLCLTLLLRRRQRVFRSCLRIVPRLLVTQHRPASHQNLARQRHDRLFLATLAAAGEP